ncbi:hypothetical protein D3C81_2225450 [compost metagenome]
MNAPISRNTASMITLTVEPRNTNMQIRESETSMAPSRMFMMERLAPFSSGSCALREAKL